MYCCLSATAFAETSVTLPVRTLATMGGDSTVVKSKYDDVPDSELDRSEEDSEYEFTVPLPETMASVVLQTTIDAVPFRKPRAERIERLLAGDDTDVLATNDKRYLEATGRAPNRDEVRWLFRRWGADAALVTLGEHFERSRASQSPVRDCLDRNGDGTIDAEELASATQSLWQCDTNSDELVSNDELTLAAASLVRKKSVWSPKQLLVPSLDEANQTNPAISIVIDFEQDGGAFTVRSDGTIEVRGDSAYLSLGGAIVEVTAVRTKASASSDQISVGVVNDGYPIAPLLDSNQDGRLTIRELRSVALRLSELDRNGDGALTDDELRPTIRLAIGHGLCVQDFLSTVRSVHPDAAKEPATPPDWFASLDKNQDNDLSPREFLGTPEQFKKLDSDHDELINVSEAITAP